MSAAVSFSALLLLLSLLSLLFQGQMSGQHSTTELLDESVHTTINWKADVCQVLNEIQALLCNADTEERSA